MIALHSCPSGVAWLRGQVVLCGGEDYCHHFTMSGECVASSQLPMKEVGALHDVSLSTQGGPCAQAWDVQVFQTPTDMIGAAIAVVGAGPHVALYSAIGRKPVLLAMQ